MASTRAASSYARQVLDDLHVPAISHKASRGRLVTDPGRWDLPVPLQEPPQPVRDRRASLPVMSNARSSFSDLSGYPQDLSRRLELQQYEERLEALLESKLDDFREEVRALRLETGGVGSTSTEAAINGVVSLIRAQLQESAARGLDDSQMDACGELDFQLVRDIVEQGHAEARAVIQQDLDRILRSVEALQSAEGTPINGGDNAEAMMEEYHARTRDTVVDAITPISERLDALERIRTRSPLPPLQATTIDHEGLVRDLRARLVPHKPIDYDVLMEQLSQAVKPHISQPSHRPRLGQARNGRPHCGQAHTRIAENIPPCRQQRRRTCVRGASRSGDTADRRTRTVHVVTYVHLDASRLFTDFVWFCTWTGFLSTQAYHLSSDRMTR
jgi:predicted RecB family endonuclease